MRNLSLAQILLLVFLFYAVCIFLRRPSSTYVLSTEPRWVINNGFCVRPYLHAGKNVTIRLLSMSSVPNELLLSEFPMDDPGVFQDDLTLLTHSSASALDEEYLIKLLANWRGPISLAVSLQGIFDEAFVKEKIEFSLGALRDANDANRLAVHIMFEKVQNLTCDESAGQRQEENSKEGVFYASYPINTVRNVARLFSTTRYIAFADSDYLFSSEFYEKMLAILREQVPVGSKNALLYRIFEVDDDESRLRNNALTKFDLKALIDAGKARIFHGKRWPEGHAVPRLPEWLAEPESTSPGLFNLTISRPMLKNRSVWEFQFSGLRDVPLFDENFPYRVDNNLELRWEICRAGYRLLPVSDLFVYHTLSHDPHDKDDSSAKWNIKKKNRGIFTKAKKNMVKRMDLMYPDTKKECPV